MKSGKKIVSGAGALFISVLLFVGSASAHVTVKPGEALIDQYQVFTVSVPNEKDNPTISAKLEVPKSLGSITPTAIDGWAVSLEATGSGEDRRVQAVTWSGGSIPANQRGEFSFSAKMPSEATTLTWKAYQTYADGTTVSWDQAGSDDHGHSGGDSGPASLTVVTEPDTTAHPETSNNSQARYALYISIVSFVIAFTALYLTIRKRT